MIAAVAQTTSTDHSLLLAILGLLAVALPVLITIAAGRITAAASSRRAGYAAVVGDLVAYAEYPFRIRRRTSDDPDELARLAGLGNDIQERLMRSEAWVAGESRWMYERLRDARRALATTVGEASQAAWDAEPVTTARGMNLGCWGPRNVSSVVESFESAIGCRFGWRRLACVVGVQPGWRQHRPELGERGHDDGTLSSS